MKVLSLILSIPLIVQCASASDAKTGGQKVKAERLQKPKVAHTKPQMNRHDDLLNAIRDKYSKYEQVNLDVTKTTYLEVLDKTKVSSQDIFISNDGSIRIDTNMVPKSTTILSNRRALVIDEPDPEFGGPVRVLINKDPMLKQSQAFLTVLFGKEDLQSFYTVTQKSATRYALKAVKPSLSAQQIDLKLDPKNLQIVEIAYWDELKNKTTLKINTTAFLLEKTESLFNYKIPNDAEVTEI